MDDSQLRVPRARTSPAAALADVADVLRHVMFDCRSMYLLSVSGKLTADEYPHVDANHRILVRLLSIISAYYARGPLSKAGRSPDVAGYLRVTPANDGDEVFLPWHVINDIPPEPVLAEISTIARHIKDSTASSICISGSALYFGTLRCIGDLDFCEYNAQDGANPKAPFSRLAHGRRLDLSGLRRPDYVKYYAYTTFAGAIEVTKKKVCVSACTVGRILPEEARYVFQEAPVGRPWRILSDPLPMGAHLDYLLDAVEQQLTKRPLKALKRAFSLARFVMDSRLGDSIAHLLDVGIRRQALIIQKKVNMLEQIERYEAHLFAYYEDKLLDDICDLRVSASGAPYSAEGRLDVEEITALENLETDVVDLLQGYTKGLEAHFAEQ